MSLKDMAHQILSDKSGTASGTKSGTSCPTGSPSDPDHGTARTSMSTGENAHCPSVPNLYTGIVGHYAESGTPSGTESGTLPESNPFLTTIDDPEGSRAMLCEVPSIGDFWCVADEVAHNEVVGDGLPCLLPEDLAFITEGTTKQDRFNRLLGRVSHNHPTVQGVLELFPGAQVTKVTRRDPA